MLLDVQSIISLTKLLVSVFLKFSSTPKIKCAKKIC